MKQSGIFKLIYSLVLLVIQMLVRGHVWGFSDVLFLDHSAFKTEHLRSFVWGFEWLEEPEELWLSQVHVFFSQAANQASKPAQQNCQIRNKDKKQLKTRTHLLIMNLLLLFVEFSLE